MTNDEVLSVFLSKTTRAWQVTTDFFINERSRRVNPPPYTLPPPPPPPGYKPSRWTLEFTIYEKS